MKRTFVIRQDTAPNRAVPVDTGRFFLAGLSQRGLFGSPIRLRSMEQVVSLIGTRQTYSVCYDVLETFFREGGYECYFSRVLGPAAVAASGSLTGTSGVTLVATAKEKGDWANGSTGGLTQEVINGPVGGGSTRVIIIRYGGVEVERTPEITTQAEAITWSTGSDYITYAAGGGTASLPIVAAAANLTSGADDRASVTQTHVTAALDALPSDLGPGQVASPDWQTATAHAALLLHAYNRNRYALCDTTNTTAKATLTTLAASDQGNIHGDRGSLVTPWLKINGTSPGTTRSVPASAFIAAKCAQTDRIAGPNQAPAGGYGKATSSLIQDVLATYSDTDQSDLETAGVGLIVIKNGEVTFDTNRTLVEPEGIDADMLQMSTSRYFMSLEARGGVIGLGYEHLKITRARIVALDTALTGMMQEDEANDWLLLDEDETPGSGFIVQTGEPVNTNSTIAARELNAAIGVRPAPGVDFVYLYLSKVEPTDPIG